MTTLDEALVLHAKRMAENPKETADEALREVCQALYPKAPRTRTTERDEAHRREMAAHWELVADFTAIVTARALRSPLFLVWGTQGEYSDRSEWPVKAYPTLAAAKACVARLEAYIAAGRPPEGHGSYDSMPAPPDDPGCRYSYGDPASYTVVVVPLGDES